ncbi:prolyl oligopeptidase family serine peptidase [Gramella lutea]|uniref:Prolyl oligopeptidase family serine peptidase n=1 Tax=Christiangramia lutea TaxID=1607951 RepID=A0A9X1V3Q5_9FLAO|nr:prolyl oligopeptidase family serine peptidase [Christiangramia lutea]MCH4822314.1 prolyl oligopeptidase family serine peptidase [Christiangramia lutea]
MPRYLFAFLFLSSVLSLNAQKSDLSVKKIMQDTDWMGNFPSSVKWGIHSENIYFDYNPEGNPADSLYRVSIKNPEKIVQVSAEDQRSMIPTSGDFNSSGNKTVYSRNGDIFIYDLDSREEKELLDLSFSIEDPQFLAGDTALSFEAEMNAFKYDLETGSITQLTHFKSGSEKKEEEKKLSDKEEWLKSENLELLKVVNQRKLDKENSKAYRESNKEKEDFIFYLQDKELRNLEVSPNAKYAGFSLIKRKTGKETIVPDYVDESGYTVDLDAREKVGNMNYTAELALYDLERDTAYVIDISGLPGLKDLPEYTKDYPDKEWEEKEREVIPSKFYFSNNGEKAMVNLRSSDNKDRWIAMVDLEKGTLKTIERQHDEAWLAGPGIGYTYYGLAEMGWLPDNEHIYFQSEESGYSHLYILNVKTGKKKDLTPGDYEVFDPMISKDGKHWYFTSSKVHAGERHFYKMPLMGGKMVQLTKMTGKNEVRLSPDEENMAILHSYMNQPEELFLKKTDEKAEARQITSGKSQEFSSYPWREPELIKFEARDGAMVPARLYVPEESVKNDAAVVFVHGAGYLQNAHKWWSSYFREYMFHNLLTDLGYTVIDIDYRGSAGYGRDWRTGIYRHMGGKDLTDQVDGVKYLLENHDIDLSKVGIYGGSYGGFITLMAMFTEAETFKAGAALRSVTDWAHYNHGYTSNILNEPSKDPIAYRRSSPIYFAEGLEGDLLIAHGMIDTNVHFQDVVRLAQRLIELGKEDWEMAVYPVEGHGFVEPSSWTDEYRRILELFNENLLEK